MKGETSQAPEDAYMEILKSGCQSQIASTFTTQVNCLVLSVILDGLAHPFCPLVSAQEREPPITHV